MQMERRFSNGNCNYSNKFGQFCNDFDGYNNGNCNGDFDRDKTRVLISSSSSTKVSPFSSSLAETTTSFSPPSSSSASLVSTSGNGVGVGFIEHPVSKLDTLAGVAIKYGVEVSDIKKMNGLVTDLQMFALKSLQIPLPGRHPPSPCLSNGSNGAGACEQTPPRRRNSDLFDSFQSLKLNSSQRKVSPAMSSLQGYYKLKPTEPKITSGGFEMTIYRNGNSRSLEDCLRPPSPASNPPLSRHRKSRSFVNEILDEISDGIADGVPETEKSNEKLVKRRQKSEADFPSPSAETLMREDNNNGGAFSAITGKGLALRQKAASRTALSNDADSRGLSSVPFSVGDTPAVDGFFGVRKSSSTSSLQDQDGSSSSIWPTSKWSLKPDLQALSAAAIARPIFDGLPKPITGRRNKTALD